jgi:5'-3' exonuclease
MILMRKLILDRVLFIDGHNAIYRACVSFALNTAHILCSQCHDPYHDKDTHCACASPWNVEHDFCYGDKYGFVYNFFRNLRPHVELFSPNKIFFAIEGHPQFRYDLYSDYKANRIIKQASIKAQDSKDKFQQAKDIILSLLLHLPITICRAANFEADDTIGSLADNMQEEDLTVISGDADFTQLLQRGYKNIRVYNPIKKIFLEAPEYLFTAFRSLTGDKSDNIKRLVRDKKALEYCNNPVLFSKYMDVEENRALFTINRKLIEFANVPLEEIEMKVGERNFQYLKDAFNVMKFLSITKDPTWKKYVDTFSCIKY